ncbi:HlyD family efflux transporter periplasmic adaptor subunit [Pirellulaceae bacterium]|jgi:RND family efflux transporter MFP subunit|nr:HlyD family efflux transporter periplasmic adaptor subunit [Pirellulaceae bacterium]
MNSIRRIHVFRRWLTPSYSSVIEISFQESASMETCQRVHPRKTACEKSLLNIQELLLYDQELLMLRSASENPLASTNLPFSRFVVLSILIGSYMAIGCAAQSEIPGFAEANEKVEVAAVETGLLSVINVKEGDFVQANALIGQLDNEIQLAQLEIAEHLCNSTGEINRVMSELKTKESILEHFTRLSKEGFAQKKEILRAKMEVDVARAILLTRQERSIENKKKYALTKIQLNRREVRTPISGQVALVHRKKGEFVSAASPIVVTVVQSNPIAANFQVPINDLHRYTVGKPVTVIVNAKKFGAVVKGVGVTATSGTIQVRVTVPNDKYEIKIGQKCQLDPTPQSQLAAHTN